MKRSKHRPDSTPIQQFILSDGVLYVALAVGALALEWIHPLPSFASGPLAVIVVNPWQSLLHLGFGVIWIYYGRSRRFAPAACLLVGVACALLTVLGFLNLAGAIGIGGPAAPDNFLHLCTAILAFYYATTGVDDPEPQLHQIDLGPLPLWPQEHVHSSESLQESGQVR
jgi:hypothetical protein